jgi:hypothetical protein
MKKKLYFDFTDLESEKDYLLHSIEVNQGLLAWHRSRLCDLDFDSFFANIEVQRLQNQIYKFKNFISCIEEIEKYFIDLLDVYPVNIKMYTPNNMKGGFDMIFSKNKVVFVGVNRVDSNGKELCFIKIADPTTYDNLEMFPVKDLKVDELVPGEFYDAHVDCSGRYSNLNLTPCKR